MTKPEQRVRKAAMELLRAEAALMEVRLPASAKLWWGDLADDAHVLICGLLAMEERKRNRKRANPTKKGALPAY